jgi:hypothetical protein
VIRDGGHAVRVGPQHDALVLLREAVGQGRAEDSARPQLSVRVEGVHQGDETDRGGVAERAEEVPGAVSGPVLHRGRICDHQHVPEQRQQG